MQTMVQLTAAQSRHHITHILQRAPDPPGQQQADNRRYRDGKNQGDDNQPGRTGYLFGQPFLARHKKISVKHPVEINKLVGQQLVRTHEIGERRYIIGICRKKGQGLFLQLRERRQARGRWVIFDKRDQPVESFARRRIIGQQRVGIAVDDSGNGIDQRRLISFFRLLHAFYSRLVRLLHKVERNLPQGDRCGYFRPVVLDSGNDFPHLRVGQHRFLESPGRGGQLIPGMLDVKFDIGALLGIKNKIADFSNQVAGGDNHLFRPAVLVEKLAG